MISRLGLRNFMCYRGEHEIELSAHAYAITARRENDPTWSNWAGKSAILEAIDFVLFGRLNKARRFNADGWITRGEKEGAAWIILDDGTEIRRERTRGSATRVTKPSDRSRGGFLSAMTTSARVATSNNGRWRS
jgi:DNA repair exonuclease SbcCD ATPase subunit